MQQFSKLRITEIFYSLQGETSFVGIPTVFVRLTGCPLRCQYCDTSYAFQGGEWQTISEIITTVNSYKAKYVTVTGGEPLAQPAVLELMQQLCDLGYRVSLETSGALNVAKVDPRVIKILDIKTPGSAESKRNLYANFDFLQPHDQIKLVICDHNDYEWAKSLIKDQRLAERYEVLFSPSHKQLAVMELAQWILADNLPVRLQIQLHKYIWGDEPGR